MKVSRLLSGLILSLLGSSYVNAWTVSQGPMSYDDISEAREIEVSSTAPVKPGEKAKTLARTMDLESSQSAKENLDSLSGRAGKGEPESSPYETLFNGAAVAATVFEKKETKLTDEELAVSDYAQALEWINAGMEVKAEQLLATSIRQCPEHVPTRAELARLYLKRNRDEEAEMLLAEGLQFSNENPEFLKLMAMTMERKEDFSSALKYLNRIARNKQNEKDTIALFGHIHHRAGNYSLARQEYGRLMKMEPNNTLWSLGFTMALDGQGNSAAALDGYQKLLKDPNMESSLLKYVEERVVALKG